MVIYLLHELQLKVLQVKNGQEQMIQEVENDQRLEGAYFSFWHSILMWSAGTSSLSYHPFCDFGMYNILWFWFFQYKNIYTYDN